MEREKTRTKRTKVIVSVLLALVLVALCCAPAFAATLTVYGTGSSNYGGSATNGAGTEYTVQRVDYFAGYRFSYLNSAGDRYKTVDIIRSDDWSDYTGRYTTISKYNKKDLVDKYLDTLKGGSGSFTMGLTTASSSTATKDTGNYYLNYAVGSSSAMNNWGENQSYVNKVLNLMGYSVEDLSSSDQILIEPIVLLQFNRVNYALTLTEIWMKAGSQFGYDTCAKWGGTAGTYNYLGYRLNGTFPNTFYVEGNSICGPAWNLNPYYNKTSPGTGPSFHDLISNGFGLHIVKASNVVEKPDSYTVTYNANGGSGTMSPSTAHYNTNFVTRKNTFTRTGYTFNGWNEKADGTGVAWTLTSKGVYENNQTPWKWTYTKDITLYAQWDPNTYTIKFNKNASDATGSMSNMSMTYDVAKNLTANKFTRDGYTFRGWSTSSTATSPTYTDKQSVKNLTTVDGATVNLYAVWTKNESTPSIYKITCDKQDGANGCDPGDSVGGTDAFYEKYGVGYYSDSGATTKITTIEVPTRENYKFLGYYTEKNGGGTCVVSAGGTIITDPTEYTKDTTIYAKWASKSSYTVTYDANGGSGAPASQTKEHDVDLTLRPGEPTRTGYVFSHWNTKADNSGTWYLPGDTYTANASVTLYAQWVAKSSYTVTYNANGGSGAPTSQTKEHGVNLTLRTEIPTRTGYTFSHWDTQANDKGTDYSPGGTYTANASATLYAQWTPSIYTITCDKQDGANGCDAGDSVGGTDVFYEKYASGYYSNSGATTKITTIEVPTRDGYVFGGYYTEENGGGTRVVSAAGTILTGSTYYTEDTTIYALWTQRYTITYDANGGSGAPASQTKEHDENITLRPGKPTRTGYTFSHWDTQANDKGTDYSPGGTYTANASATLYAQWTPNIYTITCNKRSGEGGTDVFYEKYDNGYYSNAAATAKITKITVPTRANYTFLGYYTSTDDSGTKVVDASGNILTDDTFFTSDKTIYAQWTPNIYTITCDKQDGANGCDPGDSVGGTDAFYEKYGVGYYSDSDANTKITTIEVPTREGYTFGGYYTAENGVGTRVVNADGSITTGTTYYKADTTIYAKWTEKKYTVTYNANGGSGAPASQTKYHTQDLTLSNKIPTRTGYDFEGWNTQANGEGTDYSPGGIYTKNENVTLYAQWTPKKYTVTYNANGGSGAPASQTKQHGVNLTLRTEIPTRTGYTFVSWNTKADYSGTNYAPGGTYSANADVTLYAKWTANSYTIKFDANPEDGDVISGSTASMAMKYNVAKNLTANGFKNKGKVFIGWNTKADYSGTTYANKQSVINLTTKNNDVITLYAMWDTESYIIAFNGNGATSGNTATMSMKFGETKNLNANGFARKGYVFTGWNTIPNGNGTDYADQQAVKDLTTVVGGTVTLYAQWEPISYTIVFDGNGATGGSTASMTLKYDEEAYLTANGFTRDGYKFLKWNANPDGNGTSFSNRQSVKNLTAEDGDVITLYAQWDALSYNIVFNSNGAPKGSTPSMSLKFGETKNLTANGFINPGYHFTHWNTQANDEGTKYTDKQAVKDLAKKAGETVTLYAQWEPNEYTIVFDGNGATGGSTASMKMTYDVAKNLTPNGFTRAGYEFGGWNAESNGSGTVYTDKQLVKNLTEKNNDVITLYAQWAPPSLIDIIDVDYDGNGATKGEGWTETFEFKGLEEYVLSDNSSAFERTEIDESTGSTRLFKFMGWLLGDERYNFGVEVSAESLNNVAKDVEGRENKVATVYAAWDEYPTIKAVDRWFTLKEAQEGYITLEKLLESASAIDSEIGDKTLFNEGEGTFTIIDFDEEEFKKFDKSGSVTVTYQAIDKVGNETYRTITVHIVDKEQQTDDIVTQFTRFISDKFFKDSEGNPVPEDKGGLNEKSIWLNDPAYNIYLTDVLSNTLQDDGTWSKGVSMTFVFTKEDIASAKEYVEAHGLGNSKEANALEGFYNQFPPVTD